CAWPTPQSPTRACGRAAAAARPARPGSAWPATGALWPKSLARNHSPIICADLRNHGDSPHHQDMSMTAMVGDVRQFIEQQLDATPPQLVRSLIVVDASPQPSGSKPGWFRSIMELMLSLDLSRPPDPWRINLPALLTHIEELMGSELNSCQAVYDGPTPQGRQHSAPVPRSEIVFVEGAGHWVHADRPVEFCSKVTQFLRNCAQTAAAPGGS
uniref:AB hydrolase-1 domain-containing protein n=1 Tax=Macrostomum lignano TaxID=282301 RepID=A0A1I8IXT7_9PLAT